MKIDEDLSKQTDLLPLQTLTPLGHCWYIHL